MAFPDDLTLVKLDNLKKWLTIPSTDTAADDTLGRLITAVSTLIRNEIGRDRLVLQSCSEDFDGTGSQLMSLPVWPIASVSAVTIDGRAATDFAISKRQLKLKSCLFTRGIANVHVDWTGGIDPAGGDVFTIEQIGIKVISHEWKERSHIGIMSNTLNSQVVASYEITDLPMFAKRALRQFQSVSFI